MEKVQLEGYYIIIIIIIIIFFAKSFTPMTILPVFRIFQELRTLQESMSQQKAERQAETSTMQLSLNEVSLRLEQLQQARGFFTVVSGTWLWVVGKLLLHLVCLVSETGKAETFEVEETEEHQ